MIFRFLELWILGGIFFLPSLSISQEAEYSGAQACKPCHEQSYKMWLALPLATTQNRLSQDQQGKLQCLLCHATDVQQKLKNYRLPNVQCEACHGPGARHIEMIIKNDPKTTAAEKSLPKPTLTTCQTCHVERRSPSLFPFHFSSAIEKIRHW